MWQLTGGQPRRGGFHGGAARYEPGRRPRLVEALVPDDPLAGRVIAGLPAGHGAGKCIERIGHAFG